MLVDIINQMLQASNILNKDYTKLLKQSVILEGELSSAEMQAAVSNNYGNINPLLLTFEIF